LDALPIIPGDHQAIPRVTSRHIDTEAHLKNVSMIPGDSTVIPRNPPYNIDKTRKTPHDVKNATKHQNNIQTQSKMKIALESLLS
jgi:tRNA1(Val) A37 N6-methylase TrmN6